MLGALERTPTPSPVPVQQRRYDGDSDGWAEHAPREIADGSWWVKANASAVYSRAIEDSPRAGACGKEHQER